jgi:hypothetical protein
MAKPPLLQFFNESRSYMHISKNPASIIFTINTSRLPRKGYPENKRGQSSKFLKLDKLTHWFLKFIKHFLDLPRSGNI